MLRETARALALTLFVAGCAGAQTVSIWPGAAPGSETWTQKESTVGDTPVGAVVFNVVTPTLTAYLPERAKATGTGVVIAPGGGFVALAIDRGRPRRRALAPGERRRRVRPEVPDHGEARGRHSERNGHGRGRQVRHRGRDPGPQGRSPARGPMGRLARQGRLPGLLGRRDGDERNPAPGGHGGAPELRGDHLRRSVRRDAGNTEGAAAALSGLGAGRQPDSRPRGEVPRRVDGGRPQAGGSRLQRGRPRLRHEEDRAPPATTGSTRSTTGWKRRA